MLRWIMPAATAALMVSPGYAASPAGTWTGSYECTGIERDLTLEIEDRGGDLAAVFSFAGSGASGSYRLGGTLDAATGAIDLQPLEWLDNPNGFTMVGLTGSLVGERIEGRIDNEACGAFSVALARGATPEGPAPVNIDIPDDSPLGPFKALAEANPASVPGSEAYPFIGNWAIDIPGGAGPWFTNREIDFARQIITDTHTMTISVGASDAGALQVAPDGRYRIAWLTGKWEGTWTENTDPAFPGSILLQHPADPEDNWIVFRNGDGEMEAREYPYGGLSADRLHPIQTPAIAEYLLTSLDPSTLVGEWILYGDDSLSYSEGSLSVTPDGRYRLVDELMHREAAGEWRAKDEYLILVGGWWGEGDAALKFGDPGRAVIVSGGAEWVGVRR